MPPVDRHRGATNCQRLRPNVRRIHARTPHVYVSVCLLTPAKNVICMHQTHTERRRRANIQRTKRPSPEKQKRRGVDSATALA